MREFLKQLLTGKDNQTIDIGRVSWMLFSISLIALAAFQLFQSVTVSLREFAESAGIIAGAHGASVMLKKDTEPTEEK